MFSFKKNTLRFIKTIRPAFLGSFIKRILFPRREIVTTSKGYFWIDPGSNLGYKLLYKEGVHEPYMVKTLEKFLKPGDVFIDLAANEGYFTVIASHLVGETGKVIAIEPQQRLQNIITKNIQLNNCSNVNILPLAISNKVSTMELHLTSLLNNGATSLYRPTKYPLPKEKVKTTTLSNVFETEEIKYCKLIKIDIEGGEYEAILGSIDDIFAKNKIEAIALELHPKILSQRGLSPNQIISNLENCGYSIDTSLENLVFSLNNGQN